MVSYIIDVWLADLLGRIDSIEIIPSYDESSDLFIFDHEYNI